MKLVKLRTQNFSDWRDQIRDNTRPLRRLMISACGYEARSRYWCGEVFPLLNGNRTTEWLALGFCDSKNVEARPANEDFYSQIGLRVHDYSSDEYEPVCRLVRERVLHLIKIANKQRIEVHLDYSSMPRMWYCQLFDSILKTARPIDRIFMWYSGGAYDGAEFPTAGISDVSLFSGRPSINPSFRTHIFGLGFDRIRASAIYRVIDPQNLICFIGGTRQEYVERVKHDNMDLLAAARSVFTAPVEDFPSALARITEVARDYTALGDVVLVPDGPKPLVLASSLVPMLLKRNGIVSLHVRRRKSPDAGRIDVQPSGSVYGFSLKGEAEIAE